MVVARNKKHKEYLQSMIWLITQVITVQGLSKLSRFVFRKNFDFEGLGNSVWASHQRFYLVVPSFFYRRCYVDCLSRCSHF